MGLVKRTAAGVSVALLLVSCGGGGDISGDSSEFSITPKEYKLSLSGGSSCGSASRFAPVVVTIVGGKAPFRIVNSSPETLIIDKTEATGKDPQFRISYRSDTNLCADPSTVTVLDFFSRVATFEYSVEVEEAE
jgi:hypothetical protein